MSDQAISNVHLPDDLLCAIGHVAALWAQLEYIIDSATREALDRPQAPELDTALILPFRKRAELFAELTAAVFPKGDRLRAQMHQISTDAKRLQHQRDLIVHGSVAGSRVEQKGTATYTFRRIRWDRPVRVLERRSLSVKDIELIALEISDMVAIAGQYAIISSLRASPSRNRGRR